MSQFLLDELLIALYFAHQLLVFQKKEFYVKKKALSFVVIASLIFATASFRPKPANAIIGLASANPGLAIGGAITMGAALLLEGIGAGVGCALGSSSPNSQSGTGFTLSGDCGTMAELFAAGVAYVSGPAFIVGLILLPDQNTSIAAAPLSAEQIAALGAKVGLTAQEAASYNAENDELSAILESVSEDVMNAKPASRNEAIELAKSDLLRYKSSVSTEAFSALTKIAAYNVEMATSR